MDSSQDDAVRPPLSSSSVVSLQKHAQACAISSPDKDPLLSPKRLSPLPKQSKSPLPVPALYHDDAESDLESEDDGFDQPHHPQVAHRPMEVDVDADGEEDMLDSDVDGQAKDTIEPPIPRVVFDDDGESEMEEPESEEETDVPLSALPKLKPLPPHPQPQGTFLHVSHKIFPNHNRPFGELSPSSSSSTVFAQDRSAGSPLVPYARAPPPHTHASYQRAWLVPNPHIMHVKRREQSMMENSAAALNPSADAQSSLGVPRAQLPEIRPREVPQQYPYVIPRTPMFQERRTPGARKVLRRPYQCLYHDCQQAFPSPKDRGRHMDKHFEGRFECLRCHKKYARLDALKRHSSEQFRPKTGDGLNARPYNVTVSCVGGFEAREWVELSGSRWLKPEHVLDLRLPEPHDPLYATISRLMLEAHRDTDLYKQQQQQEASAETSATAETSQPETSSPQPAASSPESVVRVKDEPTHATLPDVEMVTLDPEDRDPSPPPLPYTPPTQSCDSTLSSSSSQAQTPVPSSVVSPPSASTESTSIPSPPPTPQSPPPHIQTQTPAITVEA
ncbi:hypothetical protein BDY19DRAFT_998559 [Irpex rosettiformis]|uniref:Uncharacterized protein n=1 Tax=Irpex rosettiformis TaxID=378272 RepID=A0ACB8TN89_9APHY|nr:hypothetical protein BDY19DRAFT_998559 [Irpex rosettiformis]